MFSKEWRYLESRGWTLVFMERQPGSGFRRNYWAKDGIGRVTQSEAVRLQREADRAAKDRPTGDVPA